MKGLTSLDRCAGGLYAAGAINLSQELLEAYKLFEELINAAKDPVIYQSADNANWSSRAAAFDRLRKALQALGELP